MSDGTQAVGTIKPQNLTNTAINGETCLVNDPVHIVNDPNVLTGSQTVPIAPIRVVAQNNQGIGKIRQLT